VTGVQTCALPIYIGANKYNRIRTSIDRNNLTATTSVYNPIKVTDSRQTISATTDKYTKTTAVSTSKKIKVN